MPMFIFPIYSCAKLQEKNVFWSSQNTYFSLYYICNSIFIPEQTQMQRLSFKSPSILYKRSFTVALREKSLIDGISLEYIPTKNLKTFIEIFKKASLSHHFSREKIHLIFYLSLVSLYNKESKEKSVVLHRGQKKYKEIYVNFLKTKSQAHIAKLQTSFYKTFESKCSAVSAINSRLYIGPSPSRFNSNKVWSPSIYDFLQGHRETHGVLQIGISTQKYLEALHLCAFIRKKGGSIYVIFDQDGEDSKSPLENSFVLPRKISPVDFKPTKKGKKNTKGRNLQKNLKTFPECETPYGWSSEKWVGGTFSNFQQVSKSVSLYGTLSRQFFRYLLQNKNLSSRYTAMQLRYRGNVLSENIISSKSSGYFLSYKEKSPVHLCYKKYPDVIIVENATKNQSAIREASALNIPVISFADSDIAEQVLSKVSIGIGCNIYNRSFFYSLLYYIYKIPVAILK